MTAAPYDFSPEIRLETDAKAALGEGPYWDDRDQKLYWVDIEGQAIHCFDPRLGVDACFGLDQMVGAVALDQAGRIICGVERGVACLDPESFQIVRLIPIESDIAENRMNEGKCDPHGRFFTGTMSKSIRPLQGALYRVDSDFSVQKLFGEVSISNGLDWTQDGKTMYYIDTLLRRVDAFDYNAMTGEISNRRPQFDLSTMSGMPDGMTLDAAGNLWIAFWGASLVRCLNPDGIVLKEISLPVSQVSSLCFGGAELTTLYITSARTGLSESQLAREPLAGGLFSIPTPIRGRRSQRFGLVN